MNTKKIMLHRYTNISELNSLLDKKIIRFSDWQGWKDENDKALLNLFKEKINKEIFVLCMSKASETIHHWSAYANNSGCRIEFNEEILFKYLEKYGVVAKEVQYVKIDQLKTNDFKIDDLPFIKRHPYNIEKEFRLIKVMNRKSASFNLKVGHDVIKKITLSPFNLDVTNKRKKKSLIKKYPELENKITFSKVNKYENWINYFTNKFSN